MNHAGGLVYALATESSRQLLWVNRSGETRPAVAERRAFNSPRISPDGQRVATTIGAGSTGSIWIHDVRNGTLTPAHRLERSPQCGVVVRRSSRALRLHPGWTRGILVAGGRWLIGADAGKRAAPQRLEHGSSA